MTKYFRRFFFSHPVLYPISVFSLSLTLYSLLVLCSLVVLELNFDLPYIEISPLYSSIFGLDPDVVAAIYLLLAAFSAAALLNHSRFFNVYVSSVVHVFILALWVYLFIAVLLSGQPNSLALVGLSNLVVLSLCNIIINPRRSTRGC